MLTEHQLINQLKLNGKDIGKLAQAGDEKAVKVMESYKMWHVCPGDRMAFALCEKAYQEWFRSVS